MAVKSLWQKCQPSQLKLWTYNSRPSYKYTMSGEEFFEKDESQTTFNAKFVNEVKLLGYIGQKPEKFESANNLIVYFSLATSRYSLEKLETKQNSTTWHSIIVKKPTLQDYVMKYISKGTRVYVSGYIDCKNFDFTEEPTKGLIHVVATEVISFKKPRQYQP